MLSFKLFLCFCCLVCCHLFLASAHNVTHILSGFPNYSTFNSLLSKYGVASQINSRSTITVLCPQNSVLNSVVSSLGSSPDAQTAFNILSYHVLLDYYDPTKLREITNKTALVTTLYQTTGLAAGSDGFVNITDVAGTPKVGLPVKGTAWKATIGKAIALYPYNISLLSIDSVIVPIGVDVGAPSPAAAPINITRVISQGGNFSTFISLLQATGVDKIFQDHDMPPGLTIFAPTNAAFDALPKGALAKLSSAQKVAILEFHGLSSYYPMESLATLTSSQNTLATGSGGGSYTLKVSPKGGSPSIVTGFNTVPVGATLYSNNPVAIYSVNSVLLPADIFGLAPSGAPAPSPSPISSPTPSPSPSPSAPSPTPSSSPTPTSSSPNPALPLSPPAPAPGKATNTPAAPSPESTSSFATREFVSHALLWFVMLISLI
eukprot:c47478_g1_i1 orf=403-1701(-)